MFLSIFLFIAGIVILYFGAIWTVKGSSNIAIFLGIRPIIIGLTIVSIGTSLPELVVSVVAAINKSKDIALGNIIGSNIANIGLVLALSAIIKPLKISASTIKKEIPIMIGVSVLLYVLAMDKNINRMDGIILFIGIVLFIIYCIFDAKHSHESGESIAGDVESIGKKEYSISYELLITSAGLIGIVLGAKLMVDSAILVARTLGLSELFIGMTIVAVGTSLPELATSMVAAYKGKVEISVGNVIGSNIFNICMVIGLVSIISPFTVDQLILNREFLIMLAFSILLLLLAMHKMTLTRTKGVLFFLGYGWFIWVTI
ncbi:MAG: calcium/sodium antiporter [Nitrospinota bacterium]|jgi:cation:H+ antiporter|nr:calcium/sodium antiporter [Nitrospinota bacterium]MDP7580504.1 calcium/sodium antiporter [Nitrospinota bacterium]HJN01906.1 calcium/sodium antiporter [Nitrospinota bacterium]